MSQPLYSSSVPFLSPLSRPSSFLLRCTSNIVPLLPPTTVIMALNQVDGMQFSPSSPLYHFCRMGLGPNARRYISISQSPLSSGCLHPIGVVPGRYLFRVSIGGSWVPWLTIKCSPVSAQEQEQEETIETKILNEGMAFLFPQLILFFCMILMLRRLVEYKNWKKNAPFLYDLLLRYV